MLLLRILLVISTFKKPTCLLEIRITKLVFMILRTTFKILFYRLAKKALVFPFVIRLCI